MSLFIRRFFLLVFAAGGAWLALRGVGMLAQQVANGDEFHLTREGEPLLIPVGLAGAMVGAFIAGLLFPVRH